MVFHIYWALSIWCCGNFINEHFASLVVMSLTNVTFSHLDKVVFLIDWI